MDETVGSTSDTSEQTPADLSSDVFAVLADRERRHVLLTLQQVATPERLANLTRSLAVATDQLDSEEVEQLHIRLYHIHVPKLEDAGLVTFDATGDTVDLTESGRELVDALDQYPAWRK